MGIAKFDGYEFQTYTTANGLVDNVVFRLFEDVNHHIWIVGMNGELAYYKNDSIHPYKYNNLLRQKLTNYNIHNAFYVDHLGGVYIGTKDMGLIIIDQYGREIKTTQKFHRAHVMFTDINDRIMASSNSGKLFRIPEEKFELNYFYRDSTFFIEPFVDNLPMRIEVISDLEENVIFNTWDKIVVLDKKSFEHVQTVQLEQRITAIKYYDDRLMVCLEYGGVYFYRFTKNHLVFEKFVLEKHSCTNYLRDSKGGHWISTINHGIFYKPNYLVSSYSSINGLKNNYIKELQQIDTSVMISYGGNFQLISQNGSLSNLQNTKTGQPYDYFGISNCHLILRDVIMADFCEHEIYPIRKTYGWANARFIGDSLYIFGRNRGWLISHQGINQIELFRKFNRIEDVEILGRDNYLIGSNSGLYKRIQDTLINIGQSKTEFSDRITELAWTAKHGLAVVSRENGLMFYKNDSTIFFSKTRGYPSSKINNLYVDFEDNIWVATDEGLFLIDAFQLDSTTYFGTINGLISNEITDVIRVSNTIYVGTKSGLSVLKFNHLPTINNSVQLKILSTSIDGNPIPFNSLIDLKSSDTDFELRFTGLNYSAAKNIAYRYRISDISPEWQTTTGRTLKLETIPVKGKYTIEIQGRILPHGEWDNSTIKFTIQVHPPFYKALWFKVLISLIIVLLIYLGFKFDLIKYNKVVQQELINRLLKRLGKQSYLIIDINRQNHRINQNDILFVQASRDYVEINTVDKKYLYRCTLKELSNQLPGYRFIRVHRSFVVQIDKIDSISKEKITIGDQVIPIGKTYQSRLKELKNQFKAINA